MTFWWRTGGGHYWLALLPLVLLAGLVLNSNLWAGTQLVLRDVKTAGGGLVRLGDVARIIDGDARQVERLERVVLAPAPAPGGELRIPVADIRARLQAQGFNLAQIEFTGKSVVHVGGRAIEQVSATKIANVPNTSKAHGEQQRKRVEAMMSDTLAQYFSRLDPALQNVGFDFKLKDDEIARLQQDARAGFQISGANSPWDAPQLLTIRWIDSQEQIQQLRLECQIVRQTWIVTARTQISRGHLVQAADVQLKPHRGNIPEGAALKLEDVVGRETKRAFRREEVLESNELRVVPLVRTNDIITVFSRQPGLSVRRQFRAKGEGAAGETITAVSLDGKQQLLVRVTGLHEADVIAAGEAAEYQRQQRDNGSSSKSPLTRTGFREPNEATTRR